MPARRPDPAGARKRLTEALPPGPDLRPRDPSNPMNLACPWGLGTGREAPLGSDSASRPDARPPRGNFGSPTLSFRASGPGVLKERVGGDRCALFEAARRASPVERRKASRPGVVGSAARAPAPGRVLEERSRVAVLQAQVLDQLRGVVKLGRKLLAEAFARLSCDRIDLAHG